jgi:hypothetical protein
MWSSLRRWVINSFGTICLDRSGIGVLTVSTDRMVMVNYDRKGPQMEIHLRPCTPPYNIGPHKSSSKAYCVE